MLGDRGRQRVARAAQCRLSVEHVEQRAGAVLVAHLDQIEGLLGSLDFAPDVMGAEGEDRHRICAGLWPCTEEVRDNMARRVAEHEEIAAAAHQLEIAA